MEGVGYLLPVAFKIDLLDLRQLPALVEEGLGGAVEAKVGEPGAAGDGLDPVVLPFLRRRFGTDEDRSRAIGIRLDAFMLRTALGALLVGGDQAAGAFLLFFTNVAGIIFSAAVVFLLHGYGDLRKGVAGIGLLLSILLLVAWPLDYSFRTLYAKAAVSRSIAELKQDQPDLFTGYGDVLSQDIVFHHDAYHLRLDVVISEKELLDFQKEVDVLSEALSKKLKRPVHIEVIVLPAKIFRTTTGSLNGTQSHKEHKGRGSGS
jgi:hypothetical protein